MNKLVFLLMVGLFMSTYVYAEDECDNHYATFATKAICSRLKQVEANQQIMLRNQEIMLRNQEIIKKALQFIIDSRIGNHKIEELK